MTTKCSKCGSTKVQTYKYITVTCIRCLMCGHDTCAELDIFPTPRSSQKAKGSFTPYKAGGKSRTK